MLLNKTYTIHFNLKKNILELSVVSDSSRARSIIKTKPTNFSELYQYKLYHNNMITHKKNYLNLNYRKLSKRAIFWSKLKLDLNINNSLYMFII
jgi:hypothetical protein